MFRFLPQNLHAERVEGADRQLIDGHFAAFLAGRGERFAFEQLAHALAHFQRGLVGECDGGDVARLEALGLDQVRNFLRDHARLAAAGAGEHETRAVKITDRFILGGVQACGHRVWMGNAVEGGGRRGGPALPAGGLEAQDHAAWHRRLVRVPCAPRGCSGPLGFAREERC